MADTKISALTASTTPLAGTEVLPIVQSSTTKQVSVANLTAGRTVAMSNATVGVGGTTSFSTGITLNGTSNAANGTFIQGQRNSSPAWFFGDTSAALGSGTGLISYVYGANPFIVYTNNGEALNVTSTQDVKATLGNFVVGTSGKGIDFSATPGTGTSELLADYEEGTWTPSVGGNATYTAQAGYYTKIGNFVKLRFWLTINVLGTGSTTTISGMPFDPSGNQPVIVGGVVCYANNLATAALSLGVYAQNGSIIRFFSRDLSLTTATNQSVAVIGNGFDVYAEVSYQV